jgi:hypothetical protein
MGRICGDLRVSVAEEVSGFSSLVFPKKNNMFFVSSCLCGEKKFFFASSAPLRLIKRFLVSCLWFWAQRAAPLQRHLLGVFAALREERSLVCILDSRFRGNDRPKAQGLAQPITL